MLNKKQCEDYNRWGLPQKFIWGDYFYQGMGDGPFQIRSSKDLCNIDLDNIKIPSEMEQMEFLYFELGKIYDPEEHHIAVSTGMTSAGDYTSYLIDQSAQRIKKDMVVGDIPQALHKLTKKVLEKK